MGLSGFPKSAYLVFGHTTPSAALLKCRRRSADWALTLPQTGPQTVVCQKAPNFNISFINGWWEKNAAKMRQKRLFQSGHFSPSGWFEWAA
jgi:hypothetical protein